MVCFFPHCCGIAQPSSAGGLLHAYVYLDTLCRPAIFYFMWGLFLLTVFFTISTATHVHHRPFLATGSHTHPALALSLPFASIYQDHYRYTDDLLTLSAYSSLSAPRTWPIYQSPIKLQELAPFLYHHPDQAFASYIHSGLVTGFRIGFTAGKIGYQGCLSHSTSAPRRLPPPRH